MKITIPTRGEVELTELLKESSEQRIKQPNIVVNALVHELIQQNRNIEFLSITLDEKTQIIQSIRDLILD